VERLPPALLKCPSRFRSATLIAAKWVDQSPSRPEIPIDWMQTATASGASNDLASPQGKFIKPTFIHGCGGKLGTPAKLANIPRRLSRAKMALVTSK
jgi:hypothetical protein